MAFPKSLRPIFTSNLVHGLAFGTPIFIKWLVGKRDIVVTILVRCMCVHQCMRQCIRTCVRPDLSGHNLYNNAWISKQFGTVVALEEEKCHLKRF